MKNDRVIERKAFLGKRRLYEYEIAENIELVDDWAFAKCTDLQRVKMPRAVLGKGVFEGCSALREIRLADCDSDTTAHLLAAVAPRNDAGYLLELKEAGSRTWYDKWDSWLKRLLESEDQEGYSGQVPCGEEDYGSSDVGAYESGRRREKAELCLLRLIYDEELEESFRTALTEYIREHRAGSEAGDESWLVLLEKHHSDSKWLEAYEKAGGVTEENIDRILAGIPEEYADMKAFFVKKRSEDKTVIEGLMI
ncbi:MAG: leucine-rich repeat domain-containing protein [Lachnospiraceae bacterium]|nr:leucine-rich repeat domain-containing protein [Lachnospiraceae bacterium]